MKKIESLNDKKFDALSDEASKFIVGGAATPTGKSADGRYSNDYSYGIPTYPDGGGDWSHAIMKRHCGEDYIPV